MKSGRSVSVCAIAILLGISAYGCGSSGDSTRDQALRDDGVTDDGSVNGDGSVTQDGSVTADNGMIEDNGVTEDTGVTDDSGVTNDNGVHEDNSVPVDNGGVCAGTMCGADCVNLQTDEDHCGSCPNACASGFSCNSGQCRPANDSLANATPWVFDAGGNSTFVQGTLVDATADLTPASGPSCVVNRPNVWYRLNITQPTIVYFDTDGTNADFAVDTAIRLTDASGNTLVRNNLTLTSTKTAFNDDDGCTGQSLDSVLGWSFTETGTYYLAVSSCSTLGRFNLVEQHVYPADIVSSDFEGTFGDGQIRTTAGGSGSTVGSISLGTPVYASWVTRNDSTEQDAFWFTSCGNTGNDTVISVCSAEGGSWTANGGADPILSLFTAEQNQVLLGQCVDDVPFPATCGPTDSASFQYRGSRVSFEVARGLFFVVVENKQATGNTMPYTLGYTNVY